MAIDVTVEDIIRNIGKNIKFNQPLYEAIVNSLEAGATDIKVEFQHDNPIPGVIPKITGFTIEDNGEGFTSKNRLAFTQLWTKNKLSLGCKGSGRFTWLSVFNKIDIESDVQCEQKHIFIPFTKDFDKSSILVTETIATSNFTKITFQKVTEKFYTIDKEEKIIDKRALADINELYNDICEYLVVKFFFLKQAKKVFKITLKIDNSERIIDQSSIPNLKCIEFQIQSELTKENFKFELYYHFFKDGQNSKRVYYCANHRATKKMDDETLGFSCHLPNNDSFIMLLCSEYFDGKDDDSRSDLIELSHQKNASFFVPLLFSDINPVVRMHISAIINEQYPELESFNHQAIQQAIDTAPYLAQFFKQDTDIVKTQESLLTNARKKFSETKLKSQNRFEKLLSNKNINSEDLTKAIENVSAIAAAELGEYILYRDNIIKALLKSISDASYDEKYIHDIFMPMKTDAFAYNDEKHLLSNLWLIDDKFMTYSYAASDKTINQIKSALGDKANSFYGRLNRPDLALFFDKKEGRRDVIMVEFKGTNANLDEKNKSLMELPVDIRVIRENIDEIGSIWSYIITTIDDKFKYTIESLATYTELFSEESELRAYYTYNKQSNSHIYIVDLRTIISDAFARNKTFLDILKKQ